MKIGEKIKKSADAGQWRVIIKDNILTLLKWIVFAVVVGVAVGAVGALFHHAINYSTTFRQEHWWMMFLLPAAGVIIVASYKLTGMSDDKGTEYVIAAVREARPLRLRTVPLIIAGTVLTHLCGGSAGREGAALQIGGAASNWLGTRLKLKERDLRVITVTGMAAGFSALFGTPLAAAVFAMEVVNVGVMYYAAIVPCFTAALVAKLVAVAMGVEATSFTILSVPDLSAANLLRLAGFGIACALVSILFCLIMRLTKRGCSKLIKNPYVRVLAGACLIIVLSLIFGTDYQGAGMDVINQAMNGTAKPWAFILKIIFTAVTLSTGFRGGEIVPAFFTGATFGCFFGALLGLPASFAAGTGLVAVFCGVTNSPLTSLILAFELFGAEGVALMALPVALSYMLSGYWSIYGNQKIMYSKIRASFIDRETH